MIIIYGFLIVINIALVAVTERKFTATMSALVAVIWGVAFGMKLTEYL